MRVVPFLARLSQMNWFDTLNSITPYPRLASGRYGAASAATTDDLFDFDSLKELDIRRMGDGVAWSVLVFTVL
jgi:hypothetical protein